MTHRRPALHAIPLCVLLSHCAHTHPATSPGPTLPLARTPANVPLPSASVPRNTALATLPSEPPRAPESTALTVPEVSTHTLANGLALWTLSQSTLPIVHVRVIARGLGSAQDPTRFPGLARFAATTLRHGTTQHDARAFALALEQTGAQLDTSTTEDATTIALDTVPEHLEATLALVGEMLAHPVFSPAEVSLVRQQEIDRVTQSMADPHWLAGVTFARAIYGQAHGYGHADTNARVLRSVTQAQLVALHAERIRAGSLQVIVVGDVPTERAQSLVQRAFADIPAGSAPALTLPAVPVATRSRTVLLVDRPASQQSFVRVGRLGVARNDPQWSTLAVAGQVLGGSPSSRLFVDLRERRSLTYGAYARNESNAQPGVFYAEGSTRLEQTADFAQGLLEHCDRLATEPVPTEELALARSVVSNRLVTSLATAADIATQLAGLAEVQLAAPWLSEHRARVATTNAESLMQAAQSHIATQRAVMVVVGPARTLRVPLARFGTVRVVSP